MRLLKWHEVNFKIGARVIKTGLGIIIALFVAQLLQLPSPLFAGVGASVAVQPTTYRSFVSLKNQFLANTIGAFVAIVLFLVLGNNPVVVGLGAIIIIWITILTKNTGTINIALVTLISIMEAHEGVFIKFALLRFLTVMVGVFSASLVNIFVMPPKHESRLNDKIQSFSNKVLMLMQRIAHEKIDRSAFKKELIALNKQLLSIDNTYSLFEDDRQFYKKRDVSKTRKLVLYQQMISTAKRADELLGKIHRYHADLMEMPAYFQERFLAQLDVLMAHHRSLNAYSDSVDKKVKVFDETNLSDLFMHLSVLKDSKKYADLTIFHIDIILSAMFEYGEYIQHLQVLLDSYKRFHDGEEEEAAFAVEKRSDDH